MAMNPYTNVFGDVVDGDARSRSAEQTYARIYALGLRKRPDACGICSQGEGIIHWHNEDYSAPLSQYVWPLCWRCHMVWHCRHKAPSKVRAYFADVFRRPIPWPPVHLHGFGVLVQDHQIYARPEPGLNRRPGPELSLSVHRGELVLSFDSAEDFLVSASVCARRIIRAWVAEA